MKRHTILALALFCVLPISALNILFVTGYFPHLSQSFILDQITECIERGHKVKIHAFHKNPHKKMQTDVKKYNLLKIVSYGENLPKLSEIDIIFVQFGYHGMAVVDQAKQQKYKGKIAVCFRGNDLTGYVQKDPRMYDKLFQQADLFLPVCDYFKELLIKYGCPEEKIVVHHSPIRTKAFAFKSRKINKGEKIHLVTVARLTEKKGIEYVIKALVQLRKKYRHIRYMVLGDGKEKHNLHRLIMDNNLQAIAHLYGWATHEEIKNVLSRSHIFILPSITGKDGDQEGIPNALKEAMAAGIPVISTFHAGIQELVTDKESGLLVEEKDVNGIVKAVELLIKNEDLYNKISRQGREKVIQDFDIKNVIDKLETIFYNLLADKKRRN